MPKGVGINRAKLYNRRLGDLQRAYTLEGVRYLPGHYHEFVGNYKGKWGCDLDQPYRLVFEPHESPVPTDENGQSIWMEIMGIEIIEMTNYHGK